MIPIIEGRDGQSLTGLIDRSGERIGRLLLVCGAVLFRRFGIDNQPAFVTARRALFHETTPYLEKATPRKALGEEVFTSTEFPAELDIEPHNENSYARIWPSKLLFACLAPPGIGGGTTIADSRAVLARIPADVVAEFRGRGWRLVRTYHPGFGLPWTEAFGTAERAQVASYCAAAGIAHQWRGEVLRTEQSGAAIIAHPITGEDVWFNHVAFWHESRLAAEFREVLLEEFGRDGLPYNFYFADGGTIPDDMVGAISAAYAAEMETIRWEKGDLLLVENMLAAHGRQAYQGPRSVVVALGDPVDRRSLIRDAGD